MHLPWRRRGRLQEEDRAWVLGVEPQDGAQVGDDLFDLVQLGVQVEDQLLVRHDLLAEPTVAVGPLGSLCQDERGE